MSMFEESNEPKSAFEALVGEGKKFKDTEALAAGKLESDRYIKELEEKKKEYEAKLEQSTKVEQLLAKLEEAEASQSVDPAPSNDTLPEDNGNTSQKPEDIKALINEAINEDRTARDAEANVRKVREAMLDKFGDGASAALKKAAEELGMPVDDLESIAARSPNAFFRMVNVNVTPSDPKSSFNTQGLVDSGNVKNWAYWTEMRKNDPASYNSPAMIKERQAARIELGDSFFKK